MINCDECGIKTNNKRFCSRRCLGKYSGNKTPTKDKSTICLHCDIVFKYKKLGQRFCSRSCSAIFHNSIRYDETRKYLSCKWCETKISNSLKENQEFCSKPCFFKYKKNNTIEEWLRDSQTGTNSHGLNKTVRLYLIEVAESKCSICNWSEINPTTGSIPLEIDHIDGNCYNNIPSNLRVLCPNCHALTPTYRALNKGNSRRNYRRKDD
jgi:hypothetical protein